jgi:hypothetical protein
MTALAAQLTATPQPLVSPVLRFAAAVAVAAVLSIVWIAAGHESANAVQSSEWAIAKATLVHLPTVEIVGHRAA